MEGEDRAVDDILELNPNSSPLPEEGRGEGGAAIAAFPQRTCKRGRPGEEVVTQKNRRCIHISRHPARTGGDAGPGRTMGKYLPYSGEHSIPETAKDWFKGTAVSRPDHACRHLLYARLDEYRTKPGEDCWPGAVRPVDEAFADARAFIERLPLSSIPAPEISLADDGEINFLWAGGDAAAYVDLGFYGTGTYSYFARGGDGRGVRGEGVPTSQGLPGEIVALLSV